MKNEGLENFVVMPRKIASDFRNRRITAAERILYEWLRLNGNPYGIATVSMESLAKDAFSSAVTDSYINKLMLSLKRKKYIYYEPRPGRRGSFEVELGDWPLPRQSTSSPLIVKKLDKFFVITPPVRPPTTTVPPLQSEVPPKVNESNQKYLEVKKLMRERFKMPPSP